LATIQKNKQHNLTAVDYEILALVHEYHFLTVSQVTRLRYSSGSETTCQDRLKKLFHAGVLDRVQLPHLGTGNTEYLYTLSTKGQKELQPLGITHFPRYRPSDTHTLRLPHLQHLLTLNDVLIAARLLCRVHPDIRLVSMLHDLDMKRTPMRVTLDRQVFKIVPDGFMDFRLSIAGRLYALPVWVEIDRGTEWGKMMQRKLYSLITAVQTHAFEALFNVSNITVAFATTEGIKRRDTIVHFLKKELEATGLSHLASVFLVAALPDIIDPLQVFLSPHMWFSPFHEKPSPLLDLSEE